MKYDLMKEIVTAADCRRRILFDGKGREYTRSKAYSEAPDILANFKKVSEALGVSSFVAAGVYLEKHIFSFETFIQDLQRCESHEECLQLVKAGEGIISRLDDMRNYLDIFECLLYEYKIHPEGYDG